ncbi:MAG: His/Gly/Thr/Pro-type tRNA ligase C-terminal domain-containing protein, partial [Gammaproteobacteria bacterium]
DILSKIIGGKEIPAVGFAMGVDRIVELLDYEDKVLVVGIAVLSNSSEDLLKYSSILRNSKTIFRLIQMDNNKSLSKQIKNAVKNNCDILVIVGEDEIRNNTLTIKYLKSNRDDNTIDLDSFTNFISGYLDE